MDSKIAELVANLERYAAFGWLKDGDLRLARRGADLKWTKPMLRALDDALASPNSLHAQMVALHLMSKAQAA